MANNIEFKNSLDVCAVIWAGNRPKKWIECVKAILKISQVKKVIIALHEDLDEGRKIFSHKKIVLEDTVSLPATISKVLGEKFNQILLVSHPVVMSADALDNAVKWIGDDPRFASVSFLSNTAGNFSFPYRNTEHPVGSPGQNETTLTKKLRSFKPLPPPVPVSVPEGGAVLFGASALNAAGNFDEDFDRRPMVMVAEFGLRASRRGFINYLDSSTYIFFPWDGVDYHGSPLNTDEVRNNMYGRHNFFPGLYDKERNTNKTPLADAIDFARAKAEGIRVLIDGWCLGPQEMGTQLLIMALSLGLAKNEAIKWVGVGVPDPAKLPAYAQKLFTTPKVEVLKIGDLTFPDAPYVDILHRPYQPNSYIPWTRWREIASRTVITIQDLIAYRNGSYFFNWNDWNNYRENLEDASAKSDAIVSISHDVVNAIKEERLSVAEDSIYVVENGIDYRSGDQPTKVPTAVVERGLTTSQFLFVLGATYSHKNRDIAIKVWQNLRKRGHNLALIMVGATVPRGSTRLEEASLIEYDADENFLVLPDVSSEERNWLLKHSCLAMYPTSAEGFGQIPFEAARFNRPSLYVAFGPLKELIEDEDAPKTWDLDALTDRAEVLITNPSAAQSAIKKTLGKIDSLSWDETARKTVDAYFNILAKTKKQL